jgi:DNA-binding YbaB/EbfC family protein
MSKGMNPQAMLKQAQKMQAKMQAIQDQASLETVEATAGGGMVTATVYGDLKLKSIAIAPEAIDPDDIDMLQDMIVAAVNQGIEDAQAMVNQKMSTVTGGMNIPGLF